MDPVLKVPATEALSTSDCDDEDEVIHVNDSKPPSPLSLQQDGGMLSVQSPPFENEPVEKPSSTLSDCSNPVKLVDADDDQSEANSDIDYMEPGTTSTWGGGAIQIVPHPQSTVSTTQSKHTALKSADDSDYSNPMAVVAPTNPTADVNRRASASSASLRSPSRTIPMKKSIQQLYGQPSWWGDGEDNYSYPHTSLLGVQDPVESGTDRDVSENPTDNDQEEHAEADVKPQPRSEAFVIDFGPGESHGSDPRSLSQFVPDRLRRGFDERERLKREREKESEQRRETLSPMPQNPQRLTRSVALRAANAKQIASGRPSTASAASGGLSRGGRAKASTTRPSTAAITTTTTTNTATARRGGLTSSRPIGVRTDRVNSSRSPPVSTPRRTVGSVPSTPLTRVSKTAGSASVTPRQANAPATRDVVNHAISRVSALQGTTTTRVGTTPGRKPSATGTTNATALTRQLSDRSAASRRTAPPGPVKPGVLVTKTGLTVTSRATTATTTGPATPTVTKTAATGKPRGVSQSRQPAQTRGFMSATTSSGAKRVTPVQPSRTNRPSTTTTTTTKITQQQQQRPSFGPTLGNSAKRPITSTQLRRPVSSTRTPIRRSHTDLVDRRSVAQPRASLPRVHYEANASLMAAIDAYDDPKAYLFHLMFQGSQEDEPTTDSVFRTFTPECPQTHIANHSASNNAIPKPDGVTAVSSPEDWLPNGETETRFVCPDTEPIPTANMIAPNTLKHDPSEPISTDPVQRYQRSSVSRHENTPMELQQHLSKAPLAAEQRHSVYTDVPKPASSSDSPKFQHRSFTTPDNSPTKTRALNTSMLVGTSVTSLAATYILEPGDTLVDRGLVSPPQSTVADQLTTPRGSMTCLAETDEVLEHEESPVHQPGADFTNGRDSHSKAPPIAKPARPSPHLGSQRARIGRPSTIRFKQLTKDVPDLTASADLPTATSTTNLERQTNTNASLSSGALSETCRDDFDLDRNKVSAMSSDALNTSVLVSASATSLALSQAATYVMDMDDTLAAQGLVPAVVVESREDLLLSPTPDLRSTLGNRSWARGGRCNTDNTIPDHANETSFTQTSQAVTPHGGMLWDVLEAEECTEDVEAGNLLEEDDTQQLLTESEIRFDSELVEDEDEIESYQLLPQPSAFQDRISSEQELESRPLRTDSGTLHPTGIASSGFRDNRYTSTAATNTAPTTDGDTGRGHSVTPGILAPVEATPGQRGFSVALKRPDRSPSSSTSPSSTSHNDEVTTATSATSPFSPVGVVRNPKPCASPEPTRHAGPRTTYAPLTDIHNCYRALQQSVNYLIQSQSGLLVAASSEDAEAGGDPMAASNPVGTNGASGNESFPQPLLRSGQPNYSAASQVAAVWPSDLTLPSGGGGARRSLSRRHRVDRTRQSTASLDSALQRWDDSGTSLTEDAVHQLKQQQQGSSFHDRRSGGAALYGSHKAFEPKSGEESTCRLDSALNGNITASGDSGLQSYSASLSQSDRKSHPTVIVEQLSQGDHAYRAAQSFRTGSASVPEPASPTGSGSSLSATNEWCSNVRRQAPVQEPSNRATAVTGLVGDTEPTSRAMNPLNRTYDFSGPNRPQILTRIARGHQLASETEYDQPLPPATGSSNEPCVNGSVKLSGTSDEIPSFDSRTFTRRKGSTSQDPGGATAFDATSYQAWVAGISALSQGIDSLTKTPLFRSSRESDAGVKTKTGQMGSASDLPDSTTDSPLPGEPVRSAFVTPIPQRSLGVPHVGPGRPAHLEVDQQAVDRIPGDPTEAATYYTLMVDSIRHLSLKLRQCSDKLVQRVNADQSAALAPSPTGRRASRASSTDSVPTSTKFALNDALENMRMINEQLKTVDELLFSHGYGEAQKQQMPLAGIVGGSAINQTQSGQGDPNHFTFVPIEREERMPRVLPSTVTSRARFVSSASPGKNRQPNVNPRSGQVHPHETPSRRHLMNEEQEYY